MGRSTDAFVGLPIWFLQGLVVQCLSNIGACAVS